MDIIERVRNYCLEKNLLNTGDRIILAVSGGPDSVMLLHILHSFCPEIGVEIAVAHIEHGLRGPDSLDDQQFVKRLTGELGLEFHTKSVSVPDIRHRGESVEEAARRVRYEFLFDLLKTTGSDKIATGHTLDDSVETVIFRLVTGTGPSGFSGILPRTGSVIHPLLAVTREQIMSYLLVKDLEYRTDRTNFDLRYPRNRIRHDIIPVFRGINERYREHIQQLADIVREESDLFESIARENLSKVLVDWTDDAVSIKHREFLAFEPAVRRRIIIEVVRNLLSEAGTADRAYLPHKVIRFLAEYDDIGNKVLYQKGGFAVQLEYGMLLFKKSVVNVQYKPYLYSVEETGIPVPIKEIKRTAIFRKRDQVETFENNKLYFDYHKLKFPIVMRSRKEGDSIYLGNLGSKKIKSLFIDEKVPKEARERVPIVESNGEICGIFLSICGKINRCAARFMISHYTKKILECELV